MDQSIDYEARVDLRTAMDAAVAAVKSRHPDHWVSCYWPDSIVTWPMARSGDRVGPMFRLVHGPGGDPVVTKYGATGWSIMPDPAY